MNYDFANFDKNFDHESLKNDYVEARKRKVHFPKIPDGCYEVSVKRMELKFSKKGDPMLAIQFEILEGEFAGEIVALTYPLMIDDLLNLEVAKLRLGDIVNVEIYGLILLIQLCMVCVLDATREPKKGVYLYSKKRGSL